MSKHIVIDPITRIEGHLRIEAVIDDNNTIVDAYSSSTMFRGIEEILKGAILVTADSWRCVSAASVRGPITSAPSRLSNMRSA